MPGHQHSAETNRAIVSFLLGARRAAQPLTQLELVDYIEHGFNPGIVNKVAKAIAPETIGFAFHFVPKATLDRRIKKRQRLTPDESARIVRAVRVWCQACSIWGDEDAARDFLFAPHPMLNGRRPVEMTISTDAGAKVVDQLIGRIEYGSAA